MGRGLRSLRAAAAARARRLRRAVRRDARHVMRIGFVSTWVNRGQSVVTLLVRVVADDAVHETFVFALPPHDAMARRGDERDWPSDGVTFASRHRPRAREYLRWARAHELDVVMCDMNLHL